MTYSRLKSDDICEFRHFFEPTQKMIHSDTLSVKMVYALGILLCSNFIAVMYACPLLDNFGVEVAWQWLYAMGHSRGDLHINRQSLLLLSHITPTIKSSY